MSDRILIHFPEADRTAGQLTACATDLEQTYYRMSRSTDALYRSGLEGRFVDELDAQLMMLRNWLSRCAAEVSEAGQDLAMVAGWARQTDDECALLFQTRGTLESGAAIALLEQVWDGSYTGWPPDQADMIFINGIWTDYASHKQTVLGLQAGTGKHVLGIYNQTDGGRWTYPDVLQALEDAFQTGDYERLIENPAIDSLVKTIEQNPGRPYELVVHSQGAAITAAALCVLASRGVDTSHLKVNTFGGAGMVYPKGPAYNHYLFAGDYVGVPAAIVGTLAGYDLTRNLPFETDAVTDDLHIVPGHVVDHDLTDYLEHYKDESPMVPSFLRETEISYQSERAYQGWQQTTSLGDWGTLEARAVDIGYTVDGAVDWDWKRFSATGDVDAHAYLGSFNLEADVAGFDAAVTGYVATEVGLQGKVLIDPFSGDAALDIGAGGFAGAKVTGELSRDFGAIETEARAGLSYGLGGTLDVDIGLENGVFWLEADANAAIGLGANAGASVELDVTEAATTVTHSVTEFIERVPVL